MPNSGKFREASSGQCRSDGRLDFFVGNHGLSSDGHPGRLGDAFCLLRLNLPHLFPMDLPETASLRLVPLLQLLPEVSGLRHDFPSVLLCASLARLVGKSDDEINRGVVQLLPGL